MNRSLPLALIVLAVAAFAASPLSQQAEEAWSRRAEPGQTERAISLWQQALKENPQDNKILIQLTMATGRACRRAVKKSEKIRWADQGKAYGAEAVAKNPEDSWAYTYNGEALGQWADAHKGLHSLSAVKQAVAELQKAVQLDPKNFYAHMLLSQFYGQAPRFSVGDKAKGLVEAQKAVQDGPQYAISHLSLARNLLELGRKQDAVVEYRKVLALTPPADAVPETLANKEDACAALKGLGESCEAKNP